MEDTKRQLASIQKIIKLEPIDGADKIEVATILGWHVVVKKGEFKVGDLCVYCEVDSVLPARPETEFLAPKYRIKTVRLRGQISQGIAFPITFLESPYPEGADVTEVLGIKKYEPPIPENMVGKMRSTFPSFIPKTDETRLQTVPQVLEKYKDITFYASEKLDGSSVTFFIKDGEFHVCSRNTDLFETPDNLIWKVAREMQIEENLRKMGENFALQGELVGGKVQGNKLKLPKPTIYFFSIFDMEKGEYVNFESCINLSLTFDIQWIPVVEYYFTLKSTVDEMVEVATRKSTLNAEVEAEGLVFRPRREMGDEDLGRLSFKVINPEFLLKNE